ncbi:MAG: HAD hydrolase family protein, partial [Deltaproteobacteria bacterium]|nr:HAD hydrolase family protein [Deltaproteobacteria bacterium]
LNFKQALAAARAHNLSLKGIYAKKVGPNVWHVVIRPKKGYRLIKHIEDRIEDDDVVGIKKQSSIKRIGRKAGFAPMRIGANVKAARTLIPEEGDIDLKKLIDDLLRYHRKYGFGVVIVSEGIKLNMDFAGNREILQEAFKKDSVASAAFKAGENEKDAFGNPKLKHAGLIISAVLNVHLKKFGIKISGGCKMDYLFRSADTSPADLKMCSKLGREAVRYLRRGEYGRILYVDKDGRVGSIPLAEKLGGRKVDYKGKDKKEYLRANQALLLRGRPRQDRAQAEINPYPLVVPRHSHEKALDEFGPGTVARAESVFAGDRCLLSPQQSSFRDGQPLKEIAYQAEEVNKISPCPSQWFLEVTNDPEKLGIDPHTEMPCVTASIIEAKVVFVHPYYFDLLEKDKQKTLYHELISHIAHKESDERVAMADTIGSLMESCSDRGTQLARDSEFDLAISLFHRGLELYHEYMSLGFPLDEGLERKHDQLEENIRWAEKEQPLKRVDLKSGELLSGTVLFSDAHKKGTPHGLANVTMVTTDGRILVQIREDKFINQESQTAEHRRDISVAGHVVKGDSSFEDAALREIKAETGLSNPKRSCLIRIDKEEGFEGAWKVGRSTYRKGYLPHYSRNKKTFYSRSKHRHNREYVGCFLYVVSPEELTEIQEHKRKLKEAEGFDYVEFRKAIEDVRANQATGKYASGILQILLSERNIEIIEKRTVEILLDSLEEVKNVRVVHQAAVGLSEMGIDAFPRIPRDMQLPMPRGIKGVLIFDVDKTIAGRNEQLLSKIREYLVEFESRGYAIVIITGQSINVQYPRVVTDTVVEETGGARTIGPTVPFLPDNRKGLFIYANEATQRYLFLNDKVREVMSYRRGFTTSQEAGSHGKGWILKNDIEKKALVDSVIREFIEQIIKQGIDSLAEVADEALRRRVEQLIKKAGKQSQRRELRDVLKSSKLKEEIRQVLAGEKPKFFDRCTQLAFKFDGFKKKAKSLRGLLSILLRVRLESRGIHGLNVTASGSTTMGVIQQGVDKATAVEDILRYLNPPASKAIYFGDEFAEGGNDYPVLQYKLDKEPQLTIVSVGVAKDGKPVHPEGTIWAGKGPEATGRVLGMLFDKLQTQAAVSAEITFEEWKQEVIKAFAVQEGEAEESLGKDNYPLVVPEKVHKRLTDKYGTGSIVRDKIVFRDGKYCLAIKQDVLNPQWERILQAYTNTLNDVAHTPVEWRVEITTVPRILGRDRRSKLPYVAAANFRTKTVFLHPYYFELTPEQHLEILYHELVSHITRCLGDRNKAAMEDTKAFFAKNPHRGILRELKRITVGGGGGSSYDIDIRIAHDGHITTLIHGDLDLEACCYDRTEVVEKNLIAALKEMGFLIEERLPQNGKSYEYYAVDFDQEAQKKIADLIELDMGPYDEPWWEREVRAAMEKKKEDVPWDYDPIVPVEAEQGVIKVRITREMLDEWGDVALLKALRDRCFLFKTKVSVKYIRMLLKIFGIHYNPDGRNIWKSFLKYEEVGPQAIAGIRALMNIFNVH